MGKWNGDERQASPGTQLSPRFKKKKLQTFLQILKIHNLHYQIPKKLLRSCGYVVGTCDLQFLSSNKPAGSSQ